MKKILAFALASVSLGLTPAPAAAATTVDVVTGVDANNDGKDDLWDVKKEGGTFSDAVIRSTPSGSASPLPGSKWISISDSTMIPSGTYVFQTIIPLSDVGDFQRIFGTWRADNIVTQIMVNNVIIFGPTGALNGDEFRNNKEQPFDIELGSKGAKLVNGDNFVQFFVRQRELSGTNNMTFNTSFSVSAVPEPGTWMMMILGLGLIGFAMRGRRVAERRLWMAPALQA